METQINGRGHISKNPYEIRLDILKMAQEVVAQNSERNGEKIDLNQIINTANCMYGFVNSSTSKTDYRT